MSRTYFFSASETGFYDSDIHIAMPADVVEIDDAAYRALIDSGKGIVADENGYPKVAEAPELSWEEQCARERLWRDALIDSNAWLVTRHRDERDLQLSTTLTEARFIELLEYLQELRDWPQSPTFPDHEQRPAAPDWIADQTQ